MTPIRVLIADDHPVVRAGLGALLSNEPDIALVGEARDGSEAVALYHARHPDVVLMDLRMPVMNGCDAVREIRRASPDARIIALTSYSGEANIYMALELGVIGYLFKDTLSRDVVDAIRAAASGKRIIPPDVATRLAEYTPRVDLTTRELEVLRLAARGLRNREIAREIGRTPETVKIHLRHVMEKLRARDRTEAVVQAVRRGIIEIE